MRWRGGLEFSVRNELLKSFGWTISRCLFTRLCLPTHSSGVIRQPRKRRKPPYSIFLGWSEAEQLKAFGKSVRIILVAPDFSRELTTTVLWLTTAGVDIRRTRIRPYSFQGRTLLEVDQLIPLREAQEYTVWLKEKLDEARRVNESNVDFSHYNLTVNGLTYSNL